MPDKAAGSPALNLLAVGRLIAGTGTVCRRSNVVVVQTIVKSLLLPKFSTNEMTSRSEVYSREGRYVEAKG